MSYIYFCVRLLNIALKKSNIQFTFDNYLIVDSRTVYSVVRFYIDNRTYNRYCIFFIAARL